MWIDELPCALWANWISSSRATGEMPFLLVYGAEAVISVWGQSCYPPEVTMISPCVQAYDEATQDQIRRDDVNLVDERRW
jgi:hypothetical protein